MARGMYSGEEIHLFAAFDELALTVGVASPLIAYMALAQKSFIHSLSGPHVDALRRACLHLEGGGFRGTDEFDDLIRFVDENKP